MINGSCCCERVKFTVKETPRRLGKCYCSRCRKVGASTIFFTKKENLNILEGREMIGSYAPEDGYKYTRNFCRNCGSSLGEILSELESVPIPANLIDDELDVQVSFEEYVEEKPNW